MNFGVRGVADLFELFFLVLLFFFPLGPARWLGENSMGAPTLFSGGGPWTVGFSFPAASLLSSKFLASISLICASRTLLSSVLGRFMMVLPSVVLNSNAVLGCEEGAGGLSS